MGGWQYQDLGDGTMRPYLKVWRDPAIPFAAIVDSGADFSCLPLQVALVLGVPFDPAAPIQANGAGGRYDCWQAAADLVLNCVEGPFTLARPMLNPSLGYILLGRRDFFHTFRVSMDERNLVFWLERY